jgi:DNA polymerase-3 subunit delta
VDALACGEQGRALTLLEELISTGEPPLRLTYMIRRQFNLVARARALIERGTSPKEIATEIKVPPFVARKLEEQGRAVSEEDLERALRSVLDLERGLKGGKDLDDALQVELAVLKLSKSPV